MTTLLGGCPSCGKQDCVARACTRTSTRTELIARLRSVGTDYDFHENALIFEAANMLEADESIRMDLTIAYMSGFKAGEDKYKAAARLALDALNESINVPCYGGHPKQEAAAAALKEVLK